MKRLVDVDGRPLGDPSVFERNSLVSLEFLTRQAARMFVDSIKRQEEIERYFAVQELRRSCGIEPPPLKFQIGIRKSSDGTEQS